MNGYAYQNDVLLNCSVRSPVGVSVPKSQCLMCFFVIFQFLPPEISYLFLIDDQINKKSVAIFLSLLFQSEQSW